MHVVVNEVNPEVGACCRLPPVALHWALYRPGLSMERDPVDPGV